MSTPGKLKKDTLQTLRGTRRDMSRAKFLLALKRQPKNVRQEAAMAHMEVELALLALGNAKIADIGKKLEKNEAELKQGAKDLKLARRKLNRIKAVLGKVDAFLQTISKVVTLSSVS